MKLKGLYRESGIEVETDLDNYFVASNTPFYLGIMLKPSKGIWEYFKNNDTLILKIGKGEKYFEAKLKYRIEVGENSIFFLTPLDEDEFRTSFLRD